jgi:hypothetical protein
MQCSSYRFVPPPPRRALCQCVKEYTVLRNEIPEATSHLSRTSVATDVIDVALHLTPPQSAFSLPDSA